MTDKSKTTGAFKPLLWVAVGIAGTMLAMLAVNGLPQGIKDALESDAQKQERLAEAQRQADEALLQSGQWRDPATGLIWTRCSLGQTWNGSGCSGEAKRFNWWDAHQAALDHSEGGQSDWRLPNAQELASLMAGKVQQGRAGYMLHHKNNGEKWWNDLSAAEQKDHEKNYFYSGQKGYVSPKLEKPAADGFSGSWASSPYVGNSGYAWFVDFDNGFVGNVNRHNDYSHVRLVRTSQSLEGGNAALLAFEQQAKNIYQDPAYLQWQENKRQEAQREAEARRERFLVGDTAYVCSGTLFGESAMCKTEVLDVSSEKIKVVHQTRCTSVAYKGYVEWVPKKSAGTVEQVRAGLRCN